MHSHFQGWFTCCGKVIPSIVTYPGLLTQTFVVCSTNAGKGLVKLITCNDVIGRWVDVWKSATFLLLSSFLNSRMSDVKRSVILQSMFAIVAHSLTCSFSGNAPLLRTVHPASGVHHCTWSVSPGLPLRHSSAASDKCWGEKAWVWGYSIVMQALSKLHVCAVASNFQLS